ncbi:MAG: lysophospholipid acyltransferase family protein [Mycobacteriales bacterium]
MTGLGDIGSRVRRGLWRLVLCATGGLTVSGELPAGGCVVVANHSSHVDTPALLAALDGRHRVRVAAAADYWFGGHRVRRLTCRWLCGAFPVRRGGGGSADLAAAVALLRAGRAVVVYPEGTRGDRVTEFHRGAFRLAEAAGVPVVPVGIAGTARLLPKHGRLRPHPVGVRIGRPLPAGDVAAARAAVVTLAAEPAPRADSALRRRVALLAGSTAGTALVAAWAAGEAVSWPLLPEFLLALVCVAAPRRGLRLPLVAALASLAGGALAYVLAARGVTAPAPLTTPRMREAVAGDIGGRGNRALAHQSLSGIPYKVYGAAAGHSRTGLPGFLLASLPARGLRICAAGLLACGFGAVVARWRRWYPAYVAAFLVLFAASLNGVLSSWS